jgi:valyl-tRNA synthetase
VPFREVYIHALVRDANREKMSKTKGNVIDPIEIVQQYGTDAVRFTLASMASPGTDIAFNVARTEGYRAFANKIWNAARFIFMNIDRAAEIGITVAPEGLGFVTGHDFSRAANDTNTGGALAPAGFTSDAPLEARWIVAEFQKTAAEVNQSLESYRYDDAANTIYQFFWGSFCDWYLEIVKIRLDFSETADKTQTKAALTTFVSVFEASLRLLSPFMPFITEEIWQALYDGNPPDKSIALTRYPKADGTPRDQDALDQMAKVQTLIGFLRALRKEHLVPERTLARFVVNTTPEAKLTYTENIEIIKRLGRVSEVAFYGPGIDSPGVTQQHSSELAAKLLYERTIDVPAERERLTKDIAKYEKGLTAAERQLGNEGFVAKAPAHIVEGLKKQEAETRLLLDKAKAALAALPKE